MYDLKNESFIACRADKPAGVNARKKKMTRCIALHLLPVEIAHIMPKINSEIPLDSVSYVDSIYSVKSASSRRRGNLEVIRGR